MSVSTDISLVCKPSDIRELYGDGMKSVEVIGWRWAESFLQQAGREGLTIWRLHGRIGNGARELAPKARIGLLNQLLLPTRQLVRLANKYRIERILLHASEVEENWKEIVSVCKGIEVSVENSDRKGAGIKEAFEAAKKLRNEGIAAKVVGDIGHFGLEMKNKYLGDDLIQQFLSNMSKFREEYEMITGAHLPINKESDKGAIDLDEMSDTALAAFIHQFEDLVIENQVNPFLQLNPSYMNRFRSNTQRRWERIKRLSI